MSDQPTGEASKPSVHEALVSVMAEVRAVGKDDYNQQQNFAFRGVDSVVNHVAPSLRRHGVVCFPRVVKADHSSRTTRSGAIQNVANIVVEYTFVGPAGDSFTGSVASEAADSGDKATAKAMSVAYRTWWLQALCLPTNEPDPDSYTYEEPVAGPPAHYEVPTAVPKDRDGWTTEFNRARYYGPTAFVQFISWCHLAHVNAPPPVKAILPKTLEELNAAAAQQGVPTAHYDFGGENA